MPQVTFSDSINGTVMITIMNESSDQNSVVIEESKTKEVQPPLQLVIQECNCPEILIVDDEPFNHLVLQGLLGM